MDVSDTESSSGSPAPVKRPKLASPTDDNEVISIIEERINVRLPRAGGSSPTAGPSQLSDGDSAEDNQDSKIAEFRNKMLNYQAEASHLRTQLKREQEKAQKAEREKSRAEGVEHYLEEKCEEGRKRANEEQAVAEQKAAAAEKKAKDLQKQCERLETKVQSKEAEIDFRDKQLGNAAKDLNKAEKKAEDAEKEAAEAKKKVADAEQKEAVANARAVDADAKKAVAEKEASALKQKLEELKKSKADAERKLRANITELENRLANTANSEQPSSSTDEQRAEELSEANTRIERQANEIAKLHADNEKLKKELTATKAKATRLETARKKAVDKKDDEIRSLKERNVVLENKLKQRDQPVKVFDARLETTRLQQAIGRFAGIADKIMLKYDKGGLSIKSNSSRPNLPRVLLELKPSFFDEYNCHTECLAQTDYSLLYQGLASHAGKEHCRIDSYGDGMYIDFKSAEEDDYDMALSVLMDDELEWAPIENNAPNHGQPDAVVITDSEVRLGGGQREHLWCSLPGDTSHQNDFKAEFSNTTPNTHLRIFVDPKYIRRCIMASSGAGSKMVEVAMNEDIVRLRYGNEHFSLTYFIPTVKPTQNGERCYSPIEYGHEIFEL